MATAFLTINYLKTALNIAFANTKYDEQIQVTIDYANNEVDKVLVPFADSVPIQSNTDLFERAKYLALLYGLVRWYRNFGVLQRADHTQRELEKAQMSLTQTLMANRTTRTERLVVGDNAKDRRLLTPAMWQTFVFGEDF